METDDFDHTPAPSGRPSLAMLRPDDDPKARDPSIEPANRAAAFRHHLLKTSTSGPTLVDRDSPAPPIVSRSSPPTNIPPPPTPTPKGEPENRHAVPSRVTSAAPTPLAPAHVPGTATHSPLIRAYDRKGIDPPQQNDGIATRMQDSMPLEGDDFWDADAPTESHSALSGTELSSPSSDTSSVMHGVVYRTSASGNVSAANVKVPAHPHQGHSMAVKVRPAFQYHPMHHSVTTGGQKELKYKRSFNKVRPFDPELEDDRSRKYGNSPVVPQSETLKEKIEFAILKVRSFVSEASSPEPNPEHHTHEAKVKPYTQNVSEDPLQEDKPAFQGLGKSLHIPLSKIRPRRNSSPGTSDSHQWHHHFPKVQPYVEETPPSGIPQSLRECGKCSTLAKGEKHADCQHEENVQHSVISEDHEDGPGLVDQVHIHSPIPVSKVRPYFTEPLLAGDHGGHGSPKVKVVKDESTPGSLCDGQNAKGTQSHHSSDDSSGRARSYASTLDYKRTAQWLRDILTHPDSYTSKFTELPEKRKNRRRGSTDPRRLSETVLSGILPSRRLTGLSAQSSKSDPKVDALVFKRAVSDLEKLLNEALSIAAEAVQQPGNQDYTAYSQPAISLNSHCHSLPESEDGRLHEHHSQGIHFANADNFEVVDLYDDGQHKRPPYQHAATYAGAPERPRLTPESLPNRTSSKRDKTRTGTGSRKLKHKAEYQDLAKGVKGAATDKPEPRSRPGAKPPVRGTTGQHATHVKHASHDSGEDDLPERDVAGRQMHSEHGISLRRRSHVSLRGAQGFSLAKSHKRQPIARDWSPARKRFVATVACISTALIGALLGIYAGLVPSIQYYIIDQSHATVHGNTGCFLGLAIPTFFLWPLPLLHGRKPYIMSSLVLAMPLLFPQAVSVQSQRLTHTGSWRAMLLASRTAMGGCLGFASMNFHSILTDIFGASLMSSNPHQEVVDRYDARRHGGGMGVWLGI
ncbi:hypothetical protein PT974_05795 [Cladobotryum mycophilum]|uniref:Polyamine transport protein n=1 Tax=Cladobotryum mycophilum TaxID=491253 RepID=A0ABR0SL20_9HYPO